MSSDSSNAIREAIEKMNRDIKAMSAEYPIKVIVPKARQRLPRDPMDAMIVSSNLEPSSKKLQTHKVEIVKGRK